jgi:anaphase-promoting complex subunit 8
VSHEELALEFDEEDVLAVGIAHVRCREFARAAHALSGCSSPRGRFLWLYSQYLVCFSSFLFVVPLSLFDDTTLRKASEKTALRDWNKLDGTFWKRNTYRTFDF